MAAARGRRRLDLTALVGLGIGLGLVVIAHMAEGGTVRSLLQPTAFLVVFGGTFGAVLLSYSADQIRHTAAAVSDVFTHAQREHEGVMVDRLVQYAIKARRFGIMALDVEIDRAHDPFLRKALTLAVEGTHLRTFREVLELEQITLEEHDEVPARVFESAGGYAPTLGILGAVLGLIHVMSNLGEPGRVGSGIAVAFVATVYGVGAANLIFLPIASRLRGRARRLARDREIVLEGVAAIQEGFNPRLVREKLLGCIGAAAGAVVPTAFPVAVMHYREAHDT